MKRIETYTGIEIPQAIPNFPELKKINHHDLLTIKQFSENHRLPYSDFNFLSILNNNINDGFKISRLNNSLVVKFLDYTTQKPFYSFIGGYHITDTIDTLIDQSKKEGLEPKLKLVPEETILLTIEGLNQKYKIEEDIDNHDYVYKIKDLAALEGGKYKQYRNMVSRFTRENPDHQLIYFKNQDTRIMLDQFQKVIKDWTNNTNNTDGIKHEYRAITRMTNFAKHFNMFNVGLYIKGKLAGFSFNELIKDKFVMSHFEKADKNITGIYQYLDYKICQKLNEIGYQYYNWQQDLGIDGLRKSKQAANPIGFIKKYTISPK